MIRNKDNRDLSAMEQVDAETVRALRDKIKRQEQRIENLKSYIRQQDQRIERLEGKVN